MELPLRRYRIFTAQGGSFAQMCARLLDSASQELRPLRLVFFGAPAGNAEYADQLEVIREAVRERFGQRRPALSYVAQRPLDADLVLEATFAQPDDARPVRYGDNYLVIGGELILGGVLPTDLDAPVYGQAVEVFEKVRSVLTEEGFTVQSIIRQWNYIEGITRMDGTRQHYQDFNDARSAFYAPADWRNGYPAATGIGTVAGGVMVELDAMLPEKGITNRALDNGLQVAAHCYSQDVLLGALNGGLDHRTTPKFERARVVGTPRRAAILISGTAAIRGEGSLRGMDAAAQTTATMENIEYLASEENLRAHGLDFVTWRNYKQLRVYVRFPEDMPSVRECLEARCPGIRKSYLCADVCRDELLVEIEGVVNVNDHIESKP